MEQLDLTGLRSDEVKLVNELLEFLKARSANPARDIEYRSWPLGVKGEIPHKEVYDCL